jgi:hypothetical protein
LSFQCYLIEKELLEPTQNITNTPRAKRGAFQKESAPQFRHRLHQKPKIQWLSNSITPQLAPAINDMLAGGVEGMPFLEDV